MQALCCSNSPSHLQAQVISALHSGSDVKVYTSSSKERSLSYLIPTVKALHHSDSSHCHDDIECSYPSILIIAPSRHYCIQLEELTKQLITGMLLLMYAISCDVM